MELFIVNTFKIPLDFYKLQYNNFQMRPKACKHLCEFFIAQLNTNIM